jgi:hypothetical protein
MVGKEGGTMMGLMMIDGKMMVGKTTKGMMVDGR